MERDLRRALSAGQFELHYQPVVNLESNEISAFEALMRWRHPHKGMISPATFIPVAEENGFVIPLGEWAIRQACAAAARWPEHTKIAVNLSPAQFRSAGLVQTVISALAASNLPPEGSSSRSPRRPCCKRTGPPSTCSISCGSWACGSRWTTSARAIRR